LCDSGLFSLTDNTQFGYSKELQREDYDVRQWTLSVTLDRDSTLRDAPNCQAWWFHVHEFFSHDPDAVRQIYEADHRLVAMVTALQDASDEMIPLIQRLGQDPDPEISWLKRPPIARS